MEPTITTDIVVAYAQCPRKAYLLLFSPDKGEPHEYTQILEQQRKEHQEKYINRLQQTHADVQPYSVENLRKGSKVLINAHLQVDGLAAECGVLTRVEVPSTFGKYSYEPSLFVGTYSITKEQQLELSFVGSVLERLQRTSPAVGRIIGMDGTSHTVKLDHHSKDLRPLLEPLHEWITADSPKPPPIVLNKHCPLCPFQRSCLAQAEQEDNLSLLDRMTSKVIQRYHRKGIFTVHQLSYRFTPRRRGKVSKSQPVRFNLELQALAIRTGKIYVQELPKLIRPPVALFLDFEGIPDQHFHYLIGLLICEGDHHIYHALWADTPCDEKRLWSELLTHLQRYPEAPIYHYGSYEPRAIEQLGRRYETPIDGFMTRMVNVNTFIYGKLYFPVRSNTLKDLGAFVGASWSHPDASGLQSLVWRYCWEETRDETYKETLKHYNAEDCRALLALTSYLTTLRDSADTQTHVDFADRPKQHATERGGDIHRVFDAMLKSAHMTYATKRVRLRSATEPEHDEPKKRGGKKGHQAYQRVLPKRAGKHIRVAPRRTCPKHKGETLHMTEHMVEHPIIDLHFTQHGCRKTVTKYVGRQGYCQQCDKYYDPRGIEHFEGCLFGHALQA